jgi:metal-responsive CopG/Arc/MetJ family transcriptional regulator
MANQMKPIPKRPALEFKYVDKKDRRMVSVRLPEALIKRLKRASEDTGCGSTELIQYAIDQFLQIQDKISK